MSTKNNAGPNAEQLVKSRGAIEAFDYKDAECAKKIREYTNGELQLALDCISDEDSAAICAESISSKGGKICYLRQPPPQKRKDVEALVSRACLRILSCFSGSD